MTPPRVVHLWAYFGHLYERAIAEEIAALVRAGVDARVLSFRPSATQSGSPTDQALRPRADFLDVVRAGGPAAGLLNAAALLPAALRRPWALARGYGLSPERGARRLCLWLSASGRRARLAGWLARLKPDLIHAQHGHIAWWALPVARRLGLPMVVSVRGLDLRMMLDLAGDRLREFMDIPTRFLPRCEDMARDLERAGLPAERIAAHPSGIRVQDIVFRERTAPPEGEPIVFLVVGRLVEKKGVSDAIRALAASRAALRRCVLRVVGGGHEEAALRRLAKELGVEDRVQFVGELTQEGVWREMAAAHVFVLASREGKGGDREGVPNALKEAAAYGLPVISTDHGGIPEVVKHGETGLLAPAGDVEGLAAQFEEMAARPQRWAEMGRRGREIVANGHDIEALTPGLVDHYRATLAEGGR